MIAAPAARDRVTGKRLRISGSTGWLLRNEYPRHGAGQLSMVVPLSTLRPKITPRSQSQYCTHTGS